MKAAVLIKNGKAHQAFEMQEREKPLPDKHEVLIKVHYSGLNFADVLARLGIYPDSPELPALLGYDVSGEIEEVGEEVQEFKKGDMVTAMTRFGGYAEYAVTDARAVAKIPDTISPQLAPALNTQGCTAYYALEEMVNIFPSDHVLVHSAAGGVGTILVQLAKHKKAVVYGTAGSDEKLKYLKEMGVDVPINYKKQDFVEEIKKRRGNAGVDVIFDAVGGTTFKRGFKLLGAGGRIIIYGGAQMTDAKNIFQKVKIGLSFGFYHPVAFLGKSKSILGVNLLRIADYQKNTLKRVLNGVVDLTAQGVIKPTLGAEYPADRIADAHDFLESGKSTGKIVLKWT